MEEVDRFKWAQTMVSGLGLLGVILAVIGLATERIRRVREHDERFQTTIASRMGCFRQNSPSRLQSLFGVRTAPLEVPSLEQIFEAADRGLWTSSTLDHMSGVQAELSWIPLYEAVFEEIARPEEGEPKLIRDYAGPLRRFFDSITAKDHKDHHSTKHFKERDMYLKNKKLVSCIRKLPDVDVGPVNRAPSPEKKFAKLQSVWISGKKPCIGVTREELVALSLLTGMRIERSGNGLHYSGIGPFGLSVDLIHTDASWMLSLVRGSRIPRHAPSLGSGYTLLMAKHLACGSIPFEQSPSWVRSVYLRDDVLQAIKAGQYIIDVPAYGGPTLEFLRRLPGDKAVDAYYGTSIDVDRRDKRLAPGTIVTTRSTEVGWSRVVAGIAFGGLVPQAHPNVIEAVKFTTAGTAVETCVQQIEGLVDALHTRENQETTKFEVFGPFVSERCQRQGHSYVNYTFPSTDNQPRDAAAIFARYMNLLEHIVAISSNTLEEVFEAAVSKLDSVYQHRVRNTQEVLRAEETSIINTNLGDVIADIKTSIEHRNHVISLDECGDLVRCLLAAWAATVPEIMVKEHMAWPDQFQIVSSQANLTGQILNAGTSEASAGTGTQVSAGSASQANAARENLNILVMDTLPPFVSLG